MVVVVVVVVVVDMFMCIDSSLRIIIGVVTDIGDGVLVDVNTEVLAGVTIAADFPI